MADALSQALLENAHRRASDLEAQRDQVVREIGAVKRERDEANGRAARLERELAEKTALEDRIRTILDEAVSMMPVMPAQEALTLLEEHVHSLRMAVELAQRREPTQAEGDAHEWRHDQSMGASHHTGECYVPAGGWTGRRCRVCNRWVWGGPTACVGCAELESMTSKFESERALVRKMDADYSASRVGILATQGELHEHLALMVRCLEEETSQGDGIAEEHFDGYIGAKSLLTRTAPDAPQWENAQIEIAELLAKASEVPGLTATLDEARSQAAAAESKPAQYERDWYAAKSEFGTAMGKARERIRELESQALRRRHPDEAPTGEEGELLMCLRGIDADALATGRRLPPSGVRWWLPVSELLTGEMPPPTKADRNA